MARDYGNNKGANIVVRVTEQEKEQLKTLAAAKGLTLSELLRAAINKYKANP